MSDLIVFDSADSVDNAPGYTDNESAEIRLSELKGRIATNLKRTIDDILAIGEDLCEARQLVRHGRWAAWLKDNFETVYGLSPSTADRFMDTFSRFGESPDQAHEIGIPSLLYQLSNAPQTAVEDVINRIQNGQTPNNKQTGAIIQTHKDGVAALAAYIGSHGPRWMVDQVENQEMAVRPAYLMLRAIEKSDPEIRELVMRTGLKDWQVLNVLRQWREIEPQEFETITKTGLIYFEGENAPAPIPLKDISVAEAWAAWSSFKQEQSDAEWEADAPAVNAAKVCTVGVVKETDDENKFVVTLWIDDEMARKLRPLRGHKQYVVFKDLFEGNE